MMPDNPSNSLVKYAIYANNRINDISLIGQLLYESNFLKNKDTPNPNIVPIKTLKNKR